ncbi:hypothetical protein IBT47_26220 [Erwinia sp. S43]|uniref:hypothetical protein n=1 Tax=Erwinia sp. S43 TaxID=2769339 RepID=UPI00190BE406|nr:hypothetical protein [Erwinia sp. S43]MBK0035777.1 hypothetical protein [Erwinia sp. S43]
MDVNADIDQKCRDKMMVMFLSEIVNRMGVVEAGKIFRNLDATVGEEEDESMRTQLIAYIGMVREGYMKG